MSDKTHIEWTEATWNPVTGCSKVSQGCKHCYAERDWKRLSANPGTRYYGRAFTDVRIHGDVLGLPLRWKRPRRIFVNSMSDLFHEAVPDEFIDQVFAVMAAARQHTFQILTKRPERMRTYLAEQGRRLAIDYASRQIGIDEPFTYRRLPLPNVWLGTSVEDQATADERIPALLDTPAAVRWISAEPLIGPLSFRWATWACRAPSPHPDGHYWHLDGLRGIDWVVSGGESGPHARPAHPDWFRALRDQCAVAGVAYLHKQNGEWVSVSEVAGPGPHHTFPDGATVRRTGKKLAGRTIDGVIHDAYPGVQP